MIEKRPTSEVMNVDCLEYMRSLPDNHFDLCIADPRIAAYKLGFDFVGCEIDEEYFRLSEERFQRECNGIVKLSAEGTTLQQLSLF